MTTLPDGVWGYLFLLGVALVFHEPWRWLGIVLGRDLDVDSPLFAWVRAVATALVAALIMRLLLFPAGALGRLPAGVRVGAFAIGLAVFFLTRRTMAAGVAAGAIALIIGALMVA
jgi:Branched-chain amino acid transport protein (AzlD)